LISSMVVKLEGFCLFGFTDSLLLIIEFAPIIISNVAQQKRNVIRILFFILLLFCLLSDMLLHRK